MHTPLLLWLIIERFPGIVRRIVFLERLLRLKMPRILDILYREARLFPCPGLSSPFQKSHVRFLRSLRIREGSFEELRLIKGALHDETCVRRFRHCREVPLPSLAVWKYFDGVEETVEALKESPLLDWILERPHESSYKAAAVVHRVACNWSDTIRLARQLGDNSALHALIRCRTGEELLELHDLLTERVNERVRKAQREKEERPFPEPPVPGCEEIVPIRTFDDLAEEGLFMRHCVVSYASSVRAGRSYIYKVLSPQRATLEIVGHGPNVRIGQFKLARNGNPADETWLMVRHWIDDHKRTNSHASGAPVPSSLESLPEECETPSEL